MTNRVRKAGMNDIGWMVDLSHAKRVEYQKQQEQFWKMAEGSDEVQTKWFGEEIFNEDVIALCAADQCGFIIGKIIAPPAVYAAGLTLMIDDFCVKSPDLWMTIGQELLRDIATQADLKGARQVLVVCGNHDFQKSQLLEKFNLTVASKWFVGSSKFL